MADPVQEDSSRRGPKRNWWKHFKQELRTWTVRASVASAIADPWLVYLLTLKK